VRSIVAGSTSEARYELRCQTFDVNISRGDNMKYSFAFAILCSALASSNAAAIRDKIRLAQTRDCAECIQNCNSVNFSCAQSCGLSGSCVAQCTVEAASCKTRCSESK
jgi:hypothetical protein